VGYLLVIYSKKPFSAVPYLLLLPPFPSWVLLNARGIFQDSLFFLPLKGVFGFLPFLWGAVLISVWFNSPFPPVLVPRSNNACSVSMLFWKPALPRSINFFPTDAIFSSPGNWYLSCLFLSQVLLFDLQKSIVRIRFLVLRVLMMLFLFFFLIIFGPFFPCSVTYMVSI